MDLNYSPEEAAFRDEVRGWIRANLPVQGKTKMALAQTEPGARYDLGQVATRARRAGEGWVLDGDKRAVVHGGCADVLVVSARTSGEEFDRRGISLFLGTSARVVRSCGPVRSSRASTFRATRWPRRATGTPKPGTISIGSAEATIHRPGDRGRALPRPDRR
ncbi:MAG: acyl-CoA dehydrogenase family protein [Candidatus Rokubacteria bacterium]|nr:acyl-CoA dehydrogenase family protein [Candidatus Rokubacteria bacterium]